MILTLILISVAVAGTARPWRGEAPVTPTWPVPVAAAPPPGQAVAPAIAWPDPPARLIIF